MIPKKVLFTALLIAAAVSVSAGPDLLINGSFSAPVALENITYKIDLLQKTNGWIYVASEWGWKQVSAGGQSFMIPVSPSYSPKDSVRKSMLQCIADQKRTRGKATLRFNCFISKASISPGSSGNYIYATVYGLNPTSKVFNANLNASLSSRSDVKLLAVRDLAADGDKAGWTPVSMDVDLGPGYDVIIVEFSGACVSGEAGVDDVQFFSQSGAAPKLVPPAASVPVLSAEDKLPATKPSATAAPAPKPAPVSAPAVVAAPVPAAPAKTPVSVPKPAPAPAAPVVPAKVTAPVAPVVTAPAPAPEPAPVPVTVTAPSIPRPVPEPIRPPVDNLVLRGDFSGTSLALPTATGDTTAELSGRWIRSVASPWEISPYGGNLGPYARAAASRQQARLLYVASDAKRSTGSYLLHFDYILTDPSDALAVKVFVSDRDITVGTDGGVLKMNDTQTLPDMIVLPPSTGWTAYSSSVELGGGYNYIYVLFTGSGTGNTGIDNVTLSPKRR